MNNPPRRVGNAVLNDEVAVVGCIPEFVGDCGETDRVVLFVHRIETMLSR